MGLMNKDKFGNTIYPSVFKKMVIHANKFLEAGYKTCSKDNLFIKPNESGCFFLSLNGTTEIKIWEDTSGLFTFTFDAETPGWKRRRLLSNELKRLQLENVPFRVSFFFSNNPEFEDACYSNQEDGINFSFYHNKLSFEGLQDGICRNCEKDFEAEGTFCCEKCEQDYYDKVKKERFDTAPICEACNEKILWSEESDCYPILYHHVSYFPEEIIKVHDKCHARIHLTDKYPELKPPKGDADKFYGKT